MHAAAINPTDILARNGQIAARQRGFAPPYVPAMDITGTIDQIDPNINRNLKIGQKVMGMVIPAGQHGAYRQQIVLSERAVAPVPYNM